MTMYGLNMLDGHRAVGKFNNISTSIRPSENSVDVDVLWRPDLDQKLMIFSDF